MFDIDNPKAYADTSNVSERQMFPYYAGYSRSFALNLLSSLALSPNVLVLDPWNGAGTTTAAATALGIRSVGQDINPVMVLVAKSTLISKANLCRLPHVAMEIVEAAASSAAILSSEHYDPLEGWLSPQSAAIVRAIEEVINCRAFGNKGYLSLLDPITLENIDPTTAMLYVCLFTSLKKLLADFVASNPTWIKVPQLAERKNIPLTTITSAFVEEAEHATKRLIKTVVAENTVEAEVRLGNSERLAIADQTIDIVLASPPYCTRIDYAVATRVELAIIRSSVKDFDTLRRSMMGTATVPRQPIAKNPKWGATCLKFLADSYDHTSVASKTYYYKSHTQYYQSLYASLGEIERVLKKGGGCFLVVQDSFYKDLLNPLCQIVTEMCENIGLRLSHEASFIAAKSMASLNPKAKKYRSDRRTVEKVLYFLK